MERSENFKLRPATFDDVPLQPPYLPDETEETIKALEEAIVDPCSCNCCGTWELVSGDTYVPMVWVQFSRGYMAFDARDEIGRKILEKLQNPTSQQISQPENQPRAPAF